MAAIPPFEADGLLPPGEYEVSFDELRQSILVVGQSSATRSPTWDTEWRTKLVDNLEILTRQLWQVGVTEVFADGSFVEDKDHPNDIDGYFVSGFDQLRSGQLTRELNLLDPYKVWTWDPASRRPYRGYLKRHFRCGTSIGLSFIHMFRALAWEAASGTGTAMSWSSLRRFARRGATASREAS